MRPLLIAAALLLGACAAPAPADPVPPADPEPPAEPAPAEPAPQGDPIEEPVFGTAGWLAAVAAATTEAERAVLSATLLDAVDWRSACGEDDPTTDGRGDVALHPVAGARVLADVTCQRLGAGRVFALVDLEPGRAPRLVRAFGISDAGRPTGEPVAGFFGIPTYEPDGAGRFEVLTPRAPDRGCGLLVHYALDADGGATIEAVRLHDACDAPLPAADWPVTYTAP